jgi:hypothetical protein
MIVRKRAYLEREDAPKKGRLTGVGPVVGLTAAVVGVGMVIKGRTRGPSSSSNTPFTYRPSALEKTFAGLAVWADKTVGWHHLPLPLGLAVLIGERIQLLEKNLHDTNTLPSIPRADPKPASKAYLTTRSAGYAT